MSQNLNVIECKTTNMSQIYNKEQKLLLGQIKDSGDILDCTKGKYNTDPIYLEQK